MYHIIFIKTENITVDEIGRIICSHLLASVHTYLYIELLSMHDAVTCDIVAYYSSVDPAWSAVSLFIVRNWYHLIQNRYHLEFRGDIT